MTENIHTPQNEKESDALDTHFDDIIEMQSRDAAKRLLLDSGEQQPRLEPAQAPELLESTASSKRKIGKKILASTALAAGLVTGGVGVAQVFAEPGFTVSSEETGYTAPDGGSLWDAAEQIEGSESVDTRDLVEEIRNHPANIEILEDGLQAGETITIPVRVDTK